MIEGNNLQAAFIEDDENLIRHFKRNIQDNEEGKGVLDEQRE